MCKTALLFALLSIFAGLAGHMAGVPALHIVGGVAALASIGIFACMAPERRAVRSRRDAPPA